MNKYRSSLICKKVRIGLFILIVGFVSGWTTQIDNEQKKKAREHYEKGLYLESRREYRLSELEFRESLKIMEGNYPDAWYKLSYILSGRKEFGEAAEALGKYLKQSGQKNINITEEYEKLKLADNLQDKIHKSPSPALDDLLKYISLVSLFAEEKQNAAIPYAIQAVNLYPNSVGAILEYAELLSKIYPKQRGQELILIKKAIELNPMNARAHYLLGNFWQSEDKELAIKELKKALDLSSGKLVQAWRDIGNVYMFSGNNQEAIKAYRNYLRLAKIPLSVRDEVERLIRQLQK